MNTHEDVTVEQSRSPGGEPRVTLSVEHEWDGVESAAAVHLTREEARRLASALGVAANGKVNGGNRE